MSIINKMRWYASLTYTWYINQHCMWRCPGALKYQSVSRNNAFLKIFHVFYFLQMVISNDKII